MTWEAARSENCTAVWSGAYTVKLRYYYSRQCFDTVGWVIWPVKPVPMDLCVWRDVKPCSIQPSVSRRCCGINQRRLLQTLPTRSASATTNFGAPAAPLVLDVATLIRGGCRLQVQQGVYYSPAVPIRGQFSCQHDKSSTHYAVAQCHFIPCLYFFCFIGFNRFCFSFHFSIFVHFILRVSFLSIFFLTV